MTWENLIKSLKPLYYRLTIYIYLETQQRSQQSFFLATATTSSTHKASDNRWKGEIMGARLKPRILKSSR